MENNEWIWHFREERVFRARRLPLLQVFRVNTCAVWKPESCR